MHVTRSVFKTSIPLLAAQSYSSSVGQGLFSQNVFPCKSSPDASNAHSWISSPGILKNSRAVGLSAAPHYVGNRTAVQRTLAMPFRVYSRQYFGVEKTISIIVLEPLLL